MRAVLLLVAPVVVLAGPACSSSESPSNPPDAGASGMLQGLAGVPSSHAGSGGSGGSGASGGTGGSTGGVSAAGSTSTAGRGTTGGATGAGGSTAGTSGHGAGGASGAGGTSVSNAGGGGATSHAGASGTSGAAGAVMSSGGAAAGGMAGMGGHGAMAGSSGAGGSGSTVVGATPPMGWNSWNKFACDGLNETVVKKMADAFVTTGMKDVGYQYVNLDDCWMDGRDSSGKIKVNSSKFPSGIASLADYVHGKGLKLGLYSTPNTKTCAGIYGGYAGGVGSKDHETDDAQMWASWGVDYLKYDKCQGDLSRFAVMRDALRKTGRPIFYSINPADQGPYCTPSSCSIDLVNIANMWRIEFDISANWSSVIRLIDKDKPEYAGAGPGHWNDPDMLEVGNGLNDTEGRAHFSMWCIMAAPLITGNDLSTMSAATKAILTNAEVIAVDQDPLGQQGRVVAGSGTNQEVWSKTLTGTNTRAVALFNRGSSSASITVKWSQLGLPAGSATVRDLWQAKDLGAFTDEYTAANVASHDVVMLKIVSGS